MKYVTLDVETFSSVPIEYGTYRYVESPDFEILILGYVICSDYKQITEQDIKQIDFANGDKWPQDLLDAFNDPDCEKRAFNAKFERLCLKAYGINIPASQWYCTMVKSAYCGLPFKLDTVSKILDLKNKKKNTGTSLIKFFSIPVKPTKHNGFVNRNLAKDNQDKWEEYKLYNKYDVLSEWEIDYILRDYTISDIEHQLYVIDQNINDRGILIDSELAENCVNMNNQYQEELQSECLELTGIKNLNSPKQIIDFINNDYPVKLTKEPIETLTKDNLNTLLKDDNIKNDKTIYSLLQMRQRFARTSVKKYTKMLDCKNEDNRVRGTYQFYGANRTGRWAGRLLQLQNLSKNHIKGLDLCRDYVKHFTCNDIAILYDDVSDILSQLVRTALIADESKNKIFCVADFSAIEARVVSWLANEQWRLNVFNTDGKIYEATAVRMFNVPIEKVTKTSDYRAKAKQAELALGFGGGIAALERMGGKKMGLTPEEEKQDVILWRKANPRIVKMWHDFNDNAMEAICLRTSIISDYQGIIFSCNGEYFTITLPSGRQLFYYHPEVKEVYHEKLGKSFNSITYMDVNQTTKQWERHETYGGKLTENIVQGTARDLLGNGMINLENNNFPIVMHIHDECIAEVDNIKPENKLNKMISLMTTNPSWALDLPLDADGYVTPYYKKD